MQQILRYLIFPVLNTSGPVFMWFALTMLIPYAVSLQHQDGAEQGFLIAMGITFLIGFLFFFPTRKFRRELQPRDGFLLVTFIWTMVPLFATIPLIYELPDVAFAKLYFETMSGITTTGATVLNNLDNLPISINGWRCLLSWMGGMGLIVLAVAILPLLGVGGAQIIKAETSGPLKESKLTPRIADTAKALYIIYLGISLVCAIAYHLAGMNWPDAIMQMMTTVSLSGFAAHDASFAYFNSATIDYIAVFFMMLCGINFSLHFAVWRKRNILAYWRDPEACSWIGYLLVAILFSTVVLVQTGVYSDYWTALRFAAFSVTSVASTTGFANTDYSIWPLGLPIIFLLSSTCTSCAGSTGGGIKMIRLLILFKQAGREFIQLLYPKAVIPLTVGGNIIDNKVTFAVLAYCLLWTTSMAVCSIALIASGLDPVTATSAILACLANLGPGLGNVGPIGNYGWLNDLQLWICSFTMLIGRLELFTVFILFTRSFWRI